MEAKGRFEREFEALFEAAFDNYSDTSRESDFFFERENEIDPKYGTTRYLPIQLSKGVLPKVGVFIPQGFQPVRSIKNSQAISGIDVIVYFHGHIYPCDNNGVGKFDKDGIEYYWNTPKFKFLREELALSGRSALLIVPTFTNKLNRRSNTDSFGNLDENNKFDFLINECFAYLKNSNDIPKNSQVRNIILAGHSAGGLPMQSIICANNSLGPNIVECWGFECLYYGTDIWECRLNHNPDKNFIHYRQPNAFAGATTILKKHSNFQDVKDGKGHCTIVKEKWRTSIEKCGWLQNVDFSSGAVNREISDFGYENAFDREFSLEKAGLYTQKIVVAKLPANDGEREKAKKRGGAYVEVKESPSVFMPEIIRRARDKALKDQKNDIAAKLNPADWFNQFTRDFTFLGRRLKEDTWRKGGKVFTGKQYVHIELAKLLKAIETKFMNDLSLSGAKKAGDILLKNSPEAISGSRLTSSTATFSMHMFGLAVDVNYLGNPYIETKNDIEGINNVLKNAAALMNAQLLTYRKHVKDKFTDRYDYLEALDNTIENYFKLLDERGALEGYLQSTKSSEWRGLPVKKATEKIQKNLDNLSKLLARGGNRKDYFRKHAILDFDKRFVTGMEKMGLHWGGDYGDMMHFDLRNTGVGYYIESARKEYSAKVKRQAARLLGEKKYGEHAPE